MNHLICITHILPGSLECVNRSEVQAVPPKALQKAPSLKKHVKELERRLKREGGGGHRLETIAPTLAYT